MSTEPEPVRPSVVSMLDHLEHLISAGRRVPFSSGVLVNESETLDIIDRARLSLPEELVHAHQMLKERAQIVAAAEEEAERAIVRARADASTVLGQAQHEAQDLVARAQTEAERLVNDATARAEALSSTHTIVQTAQHHAAQTMAEADKRSEEIRAEADRYAREVMEKLEEQLVRSLATVRKGIETLPGERRRKR